MRRQEGTIIRVNPVGLAYAEDAATRNLYSFTFDKIEGYGGETPEEIGLLAGSRVAFSASGGVVRSVKIRHSRANTASAHRSE